MLPVQIVLGPLDLALTDAQQVAQSEVAEKPTAKAHRKRSRANGRDGNGFVTGLLCGTDHGGQGIMWVALSLMVGMRKRER